MLDRAVIDALFPADLPEPKHWEQQYPPRQLPQGAKVTRFGPSPTGSVNIGGVYVATIDRDISTHSGGVYLVRVEDTDQSREVEGALDQFARAFDYFDLHPDESDDAAAAYGPYHQSARETIYLTYIRHLLRQDKAYLCFATKDELADITSRQQAAKIPTGYYGKWAIWRDADPADVAAKLTEGAPYVVRFRAPADATGQRTRFTDAIRGNTKPTATTPSSSNRPTPRPAYRPTTSHTPSTTT
jgi:glutamyl-tRNA synthetase